MTKPISEVENSTVKDQVAQFCRENSGVCWKCLISSIRSGYCDSHELAHSWDEVREHVDTEDTRYDEDFAPSLYQSSSPLDGQFTVVKAKDVDDERYYYAKMDRELVVLLILLLAATVFCFGIIGIDLFTSYSL